MLTQLFCKLSKHQSHWMHKLPYLSFRHYPWSFFSTTSNTKIIILVIATPTAMLSGYFRMNACNIVPTYKIHNSLTWKEHSWREWSPLPTVLLPLIQAILYTCPMTRACLSRLPFTCFRPLHVNPWEKYHPEHNAFIICEHLWMGGFCFAYL